MHHNYRVYTDENIINSTIFAVPFSKKDDALKYAASLPKEKKVHIEEWIFCEGWTAINIGE